MDRCTFMMDRCTFMMDRCNFMMERCNFMDFKTETAIHCHSKAWKSQHIFLYNSDFKYGSPFLPQLSKKNIIL